MKRKIIHEMKISVLTLSAGFLFYGVGGLLNNLVVFFNDQVMPVSDKRCVINPHILDDDMRYSCVTIHTHLKFLCDWIHVGQATIYSPGDIGLFVGGALIALSAPICLYFLLKKIHSRLDK